jgi:hypothetical protein
MTLSNYPDDHIIAAGKGRVIIYPNNLTPEYIQKLILTVGLLPTKPTMLRIGNNLTSNKKRAKIKEKWIKTLNQTQKRSWKTLSHEYQQNYLVTGQVVIGKSQKPQNIAPTLIEGDVESVLKQLDMEDDLTKINWNL